MGQPGHAMPAVAPNRTCNYELVGPAIAPVVVALGGISATRHVTEWWGDVVGEGRFVDTTDLRVLGVDYLDGGDGRDGRPECAVSTHDQADALVATLDALDIERIHSLVGASYGGMVGLAFAERHPERVEQLVIISAPARPHPMSTALRSIQRRIVELGLETGRAFEAMSLARQLAMTTYRSAEEFADRFDGRSVGAAPLRLTPHFAVEHYLRHQGETFAQRFSPARFLALSLSADLHEVDPARIRTPALLVAADGDRIVPREQMLDLADRWGGRCRLVHLATHSGHDAFLAEPAKIGGTIKNALNSTVSA